MTAADIRREIAPDKKQLASRIAGELVSVLGSLSESPAPAHVVLTGGSMGNALLAVLPDAVSAAPEEIGWDRVHIWWGDERFVAEGSEDRNDVPALPVLRRLGIPDGNVHRVAVSGGSVADLEEAATAYAAALGRYAESVTNGLSEEFAVPAFDVLMLGVGPDGHVASLFPQHPAQNVTGTTTVAVEDSPKPPPERVSLTFPALNAAKRVWFTVAGDDKADAVHRALSGDQDPWECPASAVHGRHDTVWWLDEAAAGSLD